MARKKVKDLPEKEKKECMAIIHSASVAAGGVGTGMAQIPLADNAVITPIQIAMIIALGKVFDIEIGRSVAQGIISSAGASLIGRSASQILWGWIPVIGNAINTATAAGLTEAIGWMAVDQFWDRKFGPREYNEQNQNSETEEDSYNDEDTVEDFDLEEAAEKMREFIRNGLGVRDLDNDKALEYWDLRLSLEEEIKEGDPLYPLYEEFCELFDEL